MIRIFALVTTLVLAVPAEAQTSLGNLSSNPYAPGSTSRPGAEHDPNSVANSFGRYGSPFGANSANNPTATDAPQLYDDAGRYRGKLSANPYDADSVANPYSRYGSRYSPDSVNNPYGAGNPYAPESPHNRFGTGLKIFGRD
jgi:hypothetical protein